MSFKDAKECGIAFLGTVAISNFSTLGQTTYYIVPAGFKCIPFGLFMEADADVGANLAFTSGQVGALTDFLGTTNGDNLDAANDGIWCLPVPSATPSKVKVYPAGTVLQIDITVAGNAVSGRVDFYGRLRAV